ncbi:MAG TPA: nuclease-related domain-containing protein [Nakamurella sp.]
MPGQPINTQQRVFGRAGGSLVGASWAVNAAVAKVGRSAELRTAEVLDELAGRAGGPSVLHDLAIPIPGITANIDHVVVSGRRVLIVDSKGWRPARYWSVGGAAFRGWRRFEHARTGTPRMAVNAVTGYLRGRGVRASLVTPVVAVWPSSTRGRLSVALLGMEGCHPVRGEQLARVVRRAVGLRTADQEVVAALARLLNPGPSARTGSPRPRAGSRTRR